MRAALEGRWKQDTLGTAKKRVQLPFDFKTLHTERNVTDLIIPETM